MTYWFGWTPLWASDAQTTERSRIDLVQGLPGYSLIAGKDTLVAFTPHPSGMKTDKDASWLDVYRLHPWGAELPEVSHIRGIPVGTHKECSPGDNRCAEVNFFVDGEFTRHPGDYWFVVTWHDADYTRTTDSIVARFLEPAVVKILFVAVNEDIFDDPNRAPAAVNLVKRCFSRMPFSSDAIEEIGPSGRYWDICPDVVSIDEEELRAASCSPYDLCHLKGPVGDALQDYNRSAPVKADFAVGLFRAERCGGAGCSSGTTALCDATSPGTCTHEIGHLLSPTEEPWDRYAPLGTCGYFSRELDDAVGCRDWAYDVGTGDIVDSATNAMSWGGTGRGFYTRHFYESACIALGGECSSISQLVWITTLDTHRYLQGDGQTGQVTLTDAAEADPAMWVVQPVRQESDYTYVTIHLRHSCASSYCPFDMLIANAATGEIKTAIASYYFYYPEQFTGWCHIWEFEQIAAGIITFRCSAWGYGDWFLKWEHSGEQPSLGKPASLHEEHWTPTFQWRISWPKPYSGYPD